MVIVARYILYFFALLFILTSSGICVDHGLPISAVVDRDEYRLMNALFTGYKPELRPVLQKQHTITVKFGISLHQIIDMHEKNQILKTNLWIRQSWYNPFLVWNASYYGGISQVNMNANRVWTPDIYLYNNADEREDGAMDRFRTKIVLTSNGWSKWLAPVILSSSCKIDVKYFPFDQQACDLKFGSWTYDGFKLNIIQEGPTADTKKFVKNGEWDLVSFPAKRNEIYYICCNEPYPDVTFTLNIRRKSMYYYINIIIPCLVISAMTLLSFYLPPASGERITLVITNLLALTVFMLLVAEIMPSTSEVVPLISIYYTCTIMEVGIALVATCVVLKFYFHNPAVSDMPPWVRVIVLNWLARLLRFNVQKRINTFRRRSSVFLRVNRKASIQAATARDVYFNHRHDNLEKESITFLPAVTENQSDDTKSKPHVNFCNGDVKRASTTSVLSANHTTNVCRRESSMRSKEDEDDWLSCHGHHHCHSRNELEEPMAHLLESQTVLVNSVNTIVQNKSQKEIVAEQKQEWIIAASIVDQGCFFVFLVILFFSTVIIFSQGTPT